MFDLSGLELVLVLTVLGGLFAGIYLAVRLARRPTSRDERV